MTELLAPAIDYAENGFPLTELIAWYMQRSVPYYKSQGFPNIEETYIDQNGGELPDEGEIYKNPFLADLRFIDIFMLKKLGGTWKIIGKAATMITEEK